MDLSQIKADATRQLQTVGLTTRHLFDTCILVHEPLELGRTPHGSRRIRVGKGGVFKGERLSGTILNGTNWFVTRPDRVGEFDVRLTLQTDDGALIFMQSNGIFRFAPEVGPRIADGSAKPEDYYLRERTILETSAERYSWLNSMLAVGAGWHRPGVVGMSVYEVL